MHVNRNFMFIIIVLHTLIADLSTPMLVLSESNPNEFEVTWQKVYAPSDHMIRTYNVSVSDEKGRTLAQKSISADSENDTYSYLYLSEQSRLEYPSCSKLVFSVVAIGEDGRSSESADVSWDENVKSNCFDLLIFRNIDNLILIQRVVV